MHVLKDVNVSARDGEFLVLLGPSGCGKSTLLNMIAGLEEMSEGHIRIDDQIVDDVEPKDRDIAMVFQSYALYPSMNVAENMKFGMRVRRVPKQQQDREIQRVATMLQLGPLLSRRPSQLSGGQRQRVAMGRALVRNPKVFLFDEPLSNLDAKLRVEMRTEIKKLHNTLGTTIVYVTHDQIEAMTLATKIVVMKSGSVQQIGSPQEIYDTPANLFVAGFIGSPPMNLIRGKLQNRKGNAELVFGGGPGVSSKLNLGIFDAGWKAYQDKQVIVGIRPETISEPGSQKSGNSPTFEAVVEVVEPTGSDNLVIVSLDMHRWGAPTRP